MANTVGGWLKIWMFLAIASCLLLILMVVTPKFVMWSALVLMAYLLFAALGKVPWRWRQDVAGLGSAFSMTIALFAGVIAFVSAGIQTGTTQSFQEGMTNDAQMPEEAPHILSDVEIEQLVVQLDASLDDVEERFRKHEHVQAGELLKSVLTKYALLEQYEDASEEVRVLKIRLNATLSDVGPIYLIRLWLDKAEATLADTPEIGDAADALSAYQEIEKQLSSATKKQKSIYRRQISRRLRQVRAKIRRLKPVVEKLEAERLNLAVQRAQEAAQSALCGDSPPKVSERNGRPYLAASYYSRFAHDPDSVEIEACLPLKPSERCWQTTCKIRANNSFGAKVLQLVTFYVAGDGSILGMEELH